MKKILTICLSIIGLIISIDIILFEFFNVGVNQFQKYIIVYFIIYLFENELKDFPANILTEKSVKYPMYIAIILSFLSHFGII